MESVTIGNAELWHADCLDVLPNLPQACLVIADPPYGEYGDCFDSFLDFCRWDANPEHSWNGGRA